MQSSFYHRYGRAITLVFLAATPLIVFGAVRALRNQDNDVRQWLPSGFEETQQYDWFVEHFASDEMAVVSWPGATLEDPRLERLAEGLTPYTEPPEGAAESSSPPTRGEAAAKPDQAIHPALFRQIMTGAEAVEQLMAEPLELSRREAIRRLQGVLIGSDGRSTAVLVHVNQAGAADRHRALETIYRVAEQRAGVPRDHVRMGGPTVDSVSLDVESQRARYLLSTLSLFLALAVAWACLRSIRLIVPVFLAALLSAGLSLTLVYVTGSSMNLVMISMPPLVYVLTISGAVHLANYYREQVESGGHVRAAERAVAVGWAPLLLAACTTAIGLGSLGLSDVQPVRHFGIYSALGVLVSLPLLLLLVPSMFVLWPPHGIHHRGADAPAGHVRHWTRWMADGVVRHHASLAVLGLVLMVVAAAGLLRLKTSVKLMNLFSPQSRIITDYRWLEEQIGDLVPAEVIVRIPSEAPLSMLERMTLIGEIHSRLDAMPEVSGAMSAATFAPPLPRGGGARQIIRRTVVERLLETQWDELAELGYLSREGDDELWRVSVRVKALNDLDYGQFLAQLQQQVEPILDRHRDALGSPTVYTGVVPLVYKAQRALLDDLTTSFVSAFALVALVMVIMLRNLRGGLLSMLPNAFPVLVIFGLMGWSGRLLDIGSMMTASVALGIAVDDTVHFLSWFRRGLRAGLSRAEAIGFAYQSCAIPMMQTTLICGLGMSAFAFSDFVPTARFASLMIALLFTALIGDLVLLTALLAGPLGKFCFERGFLRERHPQLQKRPASQVAAPAADVGQSCEELPGGDDR